jgi:hypothetical protein
MMNVATVATASLIGFGLLIAHTVADHWAQTTGQIHDKDLPGAKGRWACAAHVASYTALLTAVVVGLQVLFDLPLHWYGILAGQAISAGTHYWADRRSTLTRLAEILGKGELYRLGQPRNVSAYTVVDASRVQPDGSRVQLYQHDVIPERFVGTEAYVLDQSWHWFWLGITTLVTVLL